MSSGDVVFGGGPHVVEHVWGLCPFGAGCGLTRRWVDINIHRVLWWGRGRPTRGEAVISFAFRVEAVSAGAGEEGSVCWMLEDMGVWAVLSRRRVVMIG